MAVFPSVFLIFQHSLLDKLHGLEYALVVFLGGEQFQRFLTGNLDVYAHAVGIKARLVEQFLRGTRDALQVNVAIKAVYGP